MIRRVRVGNLGKILQKRRMIFFLKKSRMNVRHNLLINQHRAVAGQLLCVGACLCLYLVLSMCVRWQHGGSMRALDSIPTVLDCTACSPPLEIRQYPNETKSCRKIMPSAKTKLNQTGEKNNNHISDEISLVFSK